MSAGDVPATGRTARQRAERAFIELTGHRPQAWVRAPGRVNLIGDHTDYNDGFVLPMAIDRSTWLAFEPGDDGVIALHSADIGETRHFALDDLPGDRAHGAGSWIEYARGIAWALAQAGRPVLGLRATVASDLPIGAGLSSSAAFELAVARALVARAGGAWDATAMARLAQRAERAWVGVNCGIMDQLVCAAGRDGQALLIDCRSLECTPVPVPAAAAVVILDTGTRRGLVDSEYGERRASCERAAQVLGVSALRDIRPAELDGRQSELDSRTYRRARHVVTENARTEAAAAALRAGDAAAFGALMDASHASLRDDYEASGPALEAMVTCARRRSECFGARLTGAGFAGCAVALVAADRAASFAGAVVADYARDAETGARQDARATAGEGARAYVCRAAAGVELVGASS